MTVPMLEIHQKTVPRPADQTLWVRRLGTVAYEAALQQMQSFTASRQATTQDELWLLQHYPVFTLGLNGNPKHVLDAGEIPVIRTDRGGQATYHGPGQLVAYVMLDLPRRGIGVVDLVRILEQSIIDLLAEHGISGNRKSGAPGVYVHEHKIAAVGLRVKRGCCYHGIALNADMNLLPFTRINPCGYPGLPVTQLRDLGVNADLPEIGAGVAIHLARLLGYTLDAVRPE